MQVQATFAGGLAEHLRAAGGASAGVAASLRDSLAQAAALGETMGGSLAAGQRRLVQLAEEAAASASAAAAAAATGALGKHPVIHGSWRKRSKAVACGGHGRDLRSLHFLTHGSPAPKCRAEHA